MGMMVVVVDVMVPIVLARPEVFTVVMIVVDGSYDGGGSEFNDLWSSVH